MKKQIYQNFAGFEIMNPKFAKSESKSPLDDFVPVLAKKIFYGYTSWLFQKNQLGIGLSVRKCAEMGPKRCFLAKNWL